MLLNGVGQSVPSLAHRPLMHSLLRLRRRNVFACI